MTPNLCPDRIDPDAARALGERINQEFSLVFLIPVFKNKERIKKLSQLHGLLFVETEEVSRTIASRQALHPGC